MDYKENSISVNSLLNMKKTSFYRAHPPSIKLHLFKLFFHLWRCSHEMFREEFKYRFNFALGADHFVCFLHE